MAQQKQPIKRQPLQITASKLRENIYSILDEVLANGQPIIIKRKGRELQIVSDKAPLNVQPKRRKYIKGDPDQLVHLDWSSEWRESK